MGGYFATRTPHHQSIARVYPAATIELGSSRHPTLNGWKAFTVRDEPYIKNYFGKDGLSKNVTPLVTSMLPPESPQREVVDWAVEREDGGRGVCVPNFYRNWQVEHLRMLIPNSIVWTAKRSVPADGVKTMLPDLATFEPASVEPQSRQPAK